MTTTNAPKRPEIGLLVDGTLHPLPSRACDVGADALEREITRHLHRLAGTTGATPDDSERRGAIQRRIDLLRWLRLLITTGEAPPIRDVMPRIARRDGQPRTNRRGKGSEQRKRERFHATRTTSATTATTTTTAAPGQLLPAVDPWETWVEQQQQEHSK